MPIKLNIIELTKNTFEAYKVAKSISKPNSAIVAFGSLYIASEINEIVNKISREKYNYE